MYSDEKLQAEFDNWAKAPKTTDLREVLTRLGKPEVTPDELHQLFVWMLRSREDETRSR